MATMDHINIVRLYSVCMGRQMMLISQFVQLGSLLSYLKKNQATLDAYTMLNFSKQIADVSILISHGLLVHWIGSVFFQSHKLVLGPFLVDRICPTRPILFITQCVYRVKLTTPLIFYICIHYHISRPT